MSAHWLELGDGVLARRHDELDLTTGLVLGRHRCLVVDTGGDRAWGEDLVSAVREVTPLPWSVVLTHGHFDHCFGTAAFLPCPVWAHPDCGPWTAHTAARQRRQWVAHYRETGDATRAGALSGTTPVPPNAAVPPGRSGSSGTAPLARTLDLGHRSMRLAHPGPGHTRHDAVVAVPDAGVLFAGDLVEQGAPPAFEDADVARWPAAARELLEFDCPTVVPGHGSPVGTEFVRAQAAELATVAKLRANLRAGRITPPEATRRSPYPADTTRTALAAT